ncbi:uncharacterized protein LOC128186309 [Crassostrea angulata]|uniref:uncharacterized protein LOC128186309 n=1 Tax=Magallana angulata TaxID=2784310 RepID=UPI0022B20F7F|nr:uncharacterized protein LOC128186309 [Crassostrea angulata]
MNCTLKMSACILLILGVLCGKAVAKVVGGECVFTQNDTIDSTEFDNTTQICCSRSGVHDRYQQGQEVDCCGEGIYRLGMDLCCNNKVLRMDIIMKTCDKRTDLLEKRKSTVKLCKDKTNSTLHQNCCTTTKLLSKRCNKRRKEIQSILDLRSLLGKSKVKKTLLMIILL